MIVPASNSGKLGGDRANEINSVLPWFFRVDPAQKKKT